MRLVDRLGDETEVFHDVLDEDAQRLLGPTTPDEYRRYLVQMYGFICPLERSIASTPEIDRYLDLHHFQKHELLRRDLSACHMTAGQIDNVPQCAVPSFKAPEEALGWAYPIERSTLGHGELFRHLASIMPGEVAFASSYLKCYFGDVGGSWKRFARSLEAFEYPPQRALRVIESAKAAFQCLRAWRFLTGQHRFRIPKIGIVRRVSGAGGGAAAAGRVGPK